MCMSTVILPLYHCFQAKAVPHKMVEALLERFQRGNSNTLKLFCRALIADNQSAIVDKYFPHVTHAVSCNGSESQR